MNTNIVIRPATEKDAALILRFIQSIADYEKMLHLVTATEELIHDSIFVKKAAEVVIAEEHDGAEKKPAGFALFFHNFSTFVGKPGLYLEDLFVYPEFRGKGIGAALFTFLIRLARDRGCGRMEWTCLDWNEPSIKFYKSFGAQAMDEWTTYRLSEDNLKNFKG